MEIGVQLELFHKARGRVPVVATMRVCVLSVCSQLVALLPICIRPPLQARVSGPRARALSPSPLGRGPHVGSETIVSPVGRVPRDERSLGGGQHGVHGTVCV